MSKSGFCCIVLLSIFLVICGTISSSQISGAGADKAVTAQNAEIKKIATGFTWAEGPAEDSDGVIYFTDNRKNRIYKMMPDKTVTVLRENSEGANGLYFDRDGVLTGCTKSLVAVDKIDGQYTVIKDSFDGEKFNSTNDLWIDQKGGIYFTDPFWGRQGGQSRVMYLFPDREKVIVAAEDMVRPNGVIGSPDGARVYVSDWDDKKTFVYNVNADGTLSDKKLFAPEGDDGMAVDTAGNVYITGGAVHVYSPEGIKLETIEAPEIAHNVIFYGKDKKNIADYCKNINLFDSDENTRIIIRLNLIVKLPYFPIT